MKRRAGYPAGLLLVLAARLALGLAYSASVPVWEADNEDGHYAYARYLAVHHHLLQSGDPEAERIFQKFQPPLYYLAAAPLVALFNLTGPFVGPERNPFLAAGDAGFNYALHPSPLTAAQAAEANAVLAVRAFSVLVSTLSVVFVFRAARRLWPSRPSRAWAATCLYAFWPQFLFTGSMVTNDVLVVALGAVAFDLSIQLTLTGFNLRRAGLLGVTLAAALLAKINALGLLPMAALALGLSFSGLPRRANWSRQAGLAAAGLVVVLAATLAWLGTSRFITAQVFQIQTLQNFVQRAPQLGTAGSQNYLVDTPRFVFRTFLASYGWGNLETEAWVYDAWLVGAVAALAGLGLWLWRRPGAAAVRPMLVAATGVISLSALALGLSISQQSAHVPGRYLLPILPGASVLLVTGWEALLPRPWRSYGHKGIAVAISLIGWFIPFVTLAPAYARPAPMTAAQAATLDRADAADFGDALRLLGRQPAEPAVAGGVARVTLCWEARAPVTVNYPLLLEVIGPDGQGYGRFRTHPGDGNYPTQAWKIGEPFCDTERLPIRGDYPAPAVGAVRVVLETKLFGPGLPVTGLTGPAPAREARLPIIVRAATTPPAPTYAVMYQLGEAIQLRGYDIAPEPGGLQVTLHWRALAAIPDSYKVFVHLRDTPTTVYAQSDQVPRAGAYPTNAWGPGEDILDIHHLAIGPHAPPLTLYAGMYQPADGNARLPITDSNGQLVPNAELILPLP